MNRLKYIKYFSAPEICLALMILAGCREEVADPDNLIGNVNEPVILNGFSYYSFLINANNITQYVVEETQLSEPLSRLDVSLTEYKAGYVEIFVTGSRSASLYAKKFNDNYLSEDTVLNKGAPVYLKMYFYKFSGNLKVDINSIFYPQ